MHKLAVAALVLAATATAHADPAPAPRVLQYWHDVSPCSDAVMIQLDQPVAQVIARWTFAGAMDERVVTPQTDVVELGTTECDEPNLDMTQLAAGGHLELIAIRADGSQITVRGLPARLATAEMPQDGNGLAHALQHGDLPSEPPPPLVPADWNPMRGIDTALWAGLGVCLLVAGGCLVLFRRRPKLII
jgi:hypothetical protein